jgi:hypothetical protein
MKIMTSLATKGTWERADADRAVSVRFTYSGRASSVSN